MQLQNSLQPDNRTNSVAHSRYGVQMLNQTFIRMFDCLFCEIWTKLLGQERIQEFENEKSVNYHLIFLKKIIVPIFS